MNPHHILIILLIIIILLLIIYTLHQQQNKYNEHFDNNSVTSEPPLSPIEISGIVIGSIAILMIIIMFVYSLVIKKKDSLPLTPNQQHQRTESILASLRV